MKENDFKDRKVLVEGWKSISRRLETYRRTRRTTYAKNSRFSGDILDQYKFQKRTSNRIPSCFGEKK
tara:strand:+ start:419 stop:619 length:201 start_codon:yes stop_codon:yes gene_type:complete